MNNKKKLSQSAIEKLMAYKIIVEKELRLFFKKQIKEAKSVDKTSYQVIKAIEDFNLRGGKRLRAALTFYSFQCFSQQKPTRELIRASMAMELIQSFLLIHDDIIDRDELRRGDLTMHKFFEKIGHKDFLLDQDTREKEHFGMAMAIFAGDICATLAGILVYELNLKHKDKVIHEINKVIKSTTFGQIIDVRFGYSNKFSKNTAIKIYKLKTASYSIEIPIKIGAILAGAGEKELAKIEDYAKPLGVAYNIQDDLLKLFGEKKKSGKPMGSDLKEGKKTLIVIKTLERATKEERLFIKSHLGNKNMTEKDFEKIKQIMIRTGALDYCTRYAKRLIKRASNLIKEQDYRNEGKDFLLGIGNYLLEREC